MATGRRNGATLNSQFGHSQGNQLTTPAYPPRNRLHRLAAAFSRTGSHTKHQGKQQIRRFFEQAHRNQKGKTKT